MVQKAYNELKVQLQIFLIDGFPSKLNLAQCSIVYGLAIWANPGIFQRI
jgi:hypothetical protein